MLRWIANPWVAAAERACTTHAHALAKRHLESLQTDLEPLNAAGGGDLAGGPVQFLQQAKICVASDAVRVATDREATFIHNPERATTGGDQNSIWESVPLVLHDCVTPGLDALQIAVEMNCDSTAKSHFTAMDVFTGQMRHSGTGNAMHLESMRRAFGPHLNINSLAVNCCATRIDGESVLLSDYMLGKSRSWLHAFKLPSTGRPPTDPPVPWL